MSQDYNKTLNLPSTEFPMRGNLPKREPAFLEKWNELDLYHTQVKKNEGKPKYILHDGPPYANGNIHLGTSLNKILKDIIVKYKNMAGFHSPYTPGWDTHGLPIELNALKGMDLENGVVDPVELRHRCRDYALSYVDIQREQFKRIGVLADFENPYLTLKPEFEASQVEVFGEMAKKGYIYKGLKPVYWCPECQTALAEAEIEYNDDKCHSIYVKFTVADDKGVFSDLNIDISKTFFVIWTTTTWTLPGNLAICLGADYNYSVVKANDEFYIIAEELVKITMEKANIVDFEIIANYKGKELEYLQTQHPFMDRTSLVINGDHVTLESGTGCVHTAPGYGVDDFEVCKKYKELGIIVAVDGKGVMTEEAGQFAGLKTDDANIAIGKYLKEKGSMLANERITHQYPHCWRCKSPILFRATKQWFCSIDGFKEEAIKAIENVQWIPGWGEERIKGMVRDRSDWCISRQRTWGVPIPIIYCKDCGEYIINERVIKSIADLFRVEGADAWYIRDLKEFIPNDIKCNCGCTEFTKETDIMDVWFDSGVSHAAVLDQKEELYSPADLYLEGADQYRGWFQSSLLTSVVCKGVAPYKAVCTHGWVVDGQGKAMHKSAGNGIEPDEITNKFGADILRLWVASSDYHSDIKISNEILNQLSEAYKKIRNTARFILGNFTNFDTKSDLIEYKNLEEIDKWAIMRLDELVQKVRKAYDIFDYHIVFQAIHNFCVIDMSNFYLDIIKDRLYCEKADSDIRHSAQTTMYTILKSVALMIAPILSFTADEIWGFIPHSDSEDERSVFLNEIPSVPFGSVDDVFKQKWDFIYKLREDAKKALELKRTDKVIGASLEAELLIFAEGEMFVKLDAIKSILSTVLIVSKVDIINGVEGEFKGDLEDVSFTVKKSLENKCERCWTYTESVGKNDTHPTLCDRCTSVID